MGRYNMALNLTRTALTRVSRRGLALSTVERADKMMPDPVDHATGLEKYELLAKQAGNEDPFFLRAINRGKGTKDETTIKWTWLSQGVPKRCECGYWMELKSHPAPDKYALPLWAGTTFLFCFSQDSTRKR